MKKYKKDPLSNGELDKEKTLLRIFHELEEENIKELQIREEWYEEITTSDSDSEGDQE